MSWNVARYLNCLVVYRNKEKQICIQADYCDIQNSVQDTKMAGAWSYQATNPVDGYFSAYFPVLCVVSMSSPLVIFKQLTNLQ
jgi:hypothetical protein